MELVYTRGRWEQILDELEKIEGYEAQTVAHIIGEDIRVASHGRIGGLQNMPSRHKVAVWLPKALASWLEVRVVEGLPRERYKRRSSRRGTYSKLDRAVDETWKANLSRTYGKEIKG